MDIFHFSLLTCFCRWLRMSMTTSNKRISYDDDDDDDDDDDASPKKLPDTLFG